MEKEIQKSIEKQEKECGNIKKLIKKLTEKNKSSWEKEGAKVSIMYN